MEVYIEVVIIDNFFITLLCAVLSYRMLAISQSIRRAIIASVVGSAAAVCYPLISASPLLLLMLKLFLCCVLCAILFIKKCSIIRGGGMFLLVTFFFGGVLFCISLMVHSNVQQALAQPVTNIPLGIIIFASLVLYLLLRRLATALNKHKNVQSFSMDAQITLFGNCIRAKAFLDTGNRLYDYVSGLPVVVLSFSCALRLLNEERIGLVMCRRGERISPSAHYISYSTLNAKNNSLLVLKPEQFILYSGKDEHTIKDVMVGVSMSELAQGYELILHPSIALY